MEQVTETRRRETLEEGLKALGPNLFGTPGLSEVMVNAGGEVWKDVSGQGLIDTGHRVTPVEAGFLIKAVAGLLGEVVSSLSPVLEGEVPYRGWRFEGVLPPVSRAPILSIRVPSDTTFELGSYFRTSDEDGSEGLLNDDIHPMLLEVIKAEREPPVDQGHREILEWALLHRKNILVGGGTSSAKTSFLKALFARGVELGIKDRFFVAEDTFELGLKEGHVVNVRTTAGVDLTALLRVALRMRPDRIWVGEVRGPEALPLLKAWNTGHDGGACSVHASSAASALNRIEELIEESGIRPIPRSIARTIDFVVFLRRFPGGSRLVTEVVGVDGWENGRYQLRKFEVS